MTLIYLVMWRHHVQHDDDGLEELRISFVHFREMLPWMKDASPLIIG